MRSIVFLIIALQSLFGASFYYQNNGIVDIGRKNILSEYEVPKEYVYSEPQLTPQNNVVVYANRLQSELMNCEIDYLGTETCPIGREVCPTKEEFVNGYGVKHTTTKSFVKMCTPGHILENGKCYLDKDYNGAKDYVMERYRTAWSGYYLNRENSISESNNIEMPPYSYLQVRHYSNEACDDDSNNVIVKINGIEKINTWCSSSKDTGKKIVFTNNTASKIIISYYYYDRHSGGGWDKSNLQEWLVALDMPGYTKETSGSLVYYYQTPTCPVNTTLQSDGSCKMQYNWYSYHCPADVNYYQNQWKVINPGLDCGNPTCTNSSTPPANNCVRVDYTCPINIDTKCGKTFSDIIDCGSGYIWNNSRCERIEKYCGDDFYNVALDQCQKITKYTKLCVNPLDIYDPIANICSSNINLCTQGVYSTVTKSCVTNFLANCNTPSYSYNSDTETCIDASKSLCSNIEYTYDPENSICRGSMTFCEPGYSLNETTLKCEKTKCGILGTTDNNSRCETTSLCPGFITSDGKCIPTTIQN